MKNWDVVACIFGALGLSLLLLGSILGGIEINEISHMLDYSGIQMLTDPIFIAVFLPFLTSSVISFIIGFIGLYFGSLKSARA